MNVTRRDFGRIAIAGAATPYLARAVAPTYINADFISPLIGASTSRDLGEGKTFPGPTAPFGIVQLGPDTVTGGDNAPGYSYENKTIEGFSYTRMSGVGWYGDFGNLLTMPMTGAFKPASGRLDHPGEGWRSKFDHTSEVAECGYYAVTLSDYNIRVELTAAPHAGMLRFTYPQSDRARIQVDLARRIGGTSTEQLVHVVNDHTIEGWMRCPEQGGGWGNGAGHVNYTCYFRTEFSKPFAASGVWTIDIPPGELQHSSPLVDYFLTDQFYEHARNATVTPGKQEAQAGHLGFYAEFKTTQAEQILVKSGISFVDLKGARRNLSEELPHWNFDAARKKARDQWIAETSRLEVSGATIQQHKIFATALYHCMIDPRKIADCDGRYIAADGTIRQEKDFHYRTIFSGWDVFRTYCPLMTILNPSLVNDTINSLIEIADLSGKGYLERWEIMNAYSGCMDGDPAIAVIADAYAKGIRKFDVTKAYAACNQTASGTGDKTNRPENAFYLEHGYVPNQVSWTLDNAYFDWCVGSLADHLGKTQDAADYKVRSKNYAKIFDPSHRSMRGRAKSGDWIPWEGATAFGQGCTESNPLQQSWFVPHDIYGLIALMGEKEFAASLENFFEKTPPSFGWNPYYNHSNEPVHHIAYLFTYVGKPWLTQKWVRRILDKAYGAGVNGICGNDDVGQMSAWYVMSALGFYPVCPGTDVYVLGAPLFERLTIALDPAWYGNKSFTVIGRNNSPENMFVQSVTLNGKPLERSWIRHHEIVAGGVLEFQMGPKPNLHRGTSKEALPPDLFASAQSGP
jgi:predicted alpha-1,2-mannosidase